MKRLIAFLCTVMCMVPVAAKNYTVTSPSGKLGMELVVDKDVRWNMSVDGTVVSEANRIALILSDGTVLGDNPGKPKLRRSSIATTVPVLFYRCARMADVYNEMTLKFKGWSLECRAYDEGWYKAPDIMTTIPEVDLEELCSYAAQKGVRIWLWGTAHLVQLTGIDKVFDKYSRMGIAGFKLDFIEGQDQESVRMLTDIAESAARHHLMLDFHGIYKPCGLMRTYPNVLNFEGVYGLEQRGYDMMRNDASIPFLRQVAGPLDYTPGAMLNAGNVDRDRQGRGGFVQGTRAHQIGLYFVFDSPFEMMCDSPSRYMRDPETPRFITSIPTVFDETSVQDGKVGEFIVTVRRAGDVWYVGGITDFTARDIDVDLSFLPAGNWKAELFRDGVYADRCGEDYRIDTVDVVSGGTLPVHMAPGGGFGMILTRSAIKDR